MCVCACVYACCVSVSTSVHECLLEMFIWMPSPVTQAAHNFNHSNTVNILNLSHDLKLSNRWLIMVKYKYPLILCTKLNVTQAAV